MLPPFLTKVPLRVTAFAWLAIRGAILNMDILQRRKMIVVNACPMCLNTEELVGHHLLNCKIAQIIWKAILEWFGVSFVMPFLITFKHGSLFLSLKGQRLNGSAFMRRFGVFGRREIRNDLKESPFRLRP